MESQAKRRLLRLIVQNAVRRGPLEEYVARHRLRRRTSAALPLASLRSSVGAAPRRAQPLEA
jgi:hypothetical protein